MDAQDRQRLDDFMDAGEAVKDFWAQPIEERVEDELVAEYEKLQVSAMDALRICVNAGESPKIMALLDAIKDDNDREVLELWPDIRESVARVLVQCDDSPIGESKPTINVATTDQGDRDRWVYERLMAGDPYPEIKAGIQKNPHWELLDSDSGIRAAGKRYAESHGKELPPTRPSGRPKNQ